MLWSAEEIIKMNVEYEVFVDLREGLGIGSNGSSEMIGLVKVDAADYKIFLIPFIDLDDKDTHIEIGNSFLNFFERLESGKEWFN